MKCLILLLPPIIIFSTLAPMEKEKHKATTLDELLTFEEFIEEEKENYLTDDEYKTEYLRIYKKIMTKPTKFDEFIRKEIPEFMYQTGEETIKTKAIIDAFFDAILNKPNRVQLYINSLPQNKLDNND